MTFFCLLISTIHFTFVSYFIAVILLGQKLNLQKQNKQERYSKTSNKQTKKISPIKHLNNNKKYLYV